MHHAMVIRLTINPSHPYMQVGTYLIRYYLGTEVLLNFTDDDDELALHAAAAVCA